MRPYEDIALKRGTEALGRLLNMAAAMRCGETDKALRHLNDAARELTLARDALDAGAVARDVSAEDLTDYLEMVRLWGLADAEATS
jgi:hypothetical protein